MKVLLIAALAILPATSIAQHHEAHEGHGTAPAAAVATPEEAGQAAFAAIAEIVAALEADPRTDWSRVDIERLRRHLVDMDNALMAAEVARADLPGGARFTATGTGRVAESLRRMAISHARAMDGADGWTMRADEIPSGVVLEVVADEPADALRIRALGFAGILAKGGHHQAHHLAMAAGSGAH